MTNKTLIVLGAGAHVPYGFPTGDQLLTDIQNESDNVLTKFLNINNASAPNTNSEHIVNHFRKNIRLWSNKIKDAMIISIDQFLFLQDEQFRKIGKEILCLHILNYESQSTDIKNIAANQDWVKFLFNKILPFDKTKENILNQTSSDFTFVTFNYDRFFENQILKALQSRWSFAPAESYSIADKLFPTFHIYGSVGSLNSNQTEYNGFGQLKGLEDIQRRLSEYIKTIYVDSVPRLPVVQDNKLFNNVLFLGFGFNDTNLKRLDLASICHPDANIYFTTINFSAKDIENIKDMINSDPYMNYKFFTGLKPEIDSYTLLKNFFLGTTE